MDINKIISSQNLSDFPVGLAGCRNSDHFFETCPFDIVVFDEIHENPKIVKLNDDFAIIRHASFSESDSDRLLSFEGLKIIQDPSWELQMFISKIKQKQDLLYSDSAKNHLIESLFCCQKSRDAISNSDPFASCWLKCASYHLFDALFSINHQKLGPSHMLDYVRKFPKNSINENLQIATETIGIERSTPTLLNRMLKSTIGFSDIVEKNNHSSIISNTHNSFVQNSKLSDCYFYLGYVNRNNFEMIKSSIAQRPELFHILKIAFDIEIDPELSDKVDLIQNTTNNILETISK